MQWARGRRILGFVVGWFGGLLSRGDGGRQHRQHGKAEGGRFHGPTAPFVQRYKEIIAIVRGVGTSLCRKTKAAACFRRHSWRVWRAGARSTATSRRAKCLLLSRAVILKES